MMKLISRLVKWLNNISKAMAIISAAMIVIIVFIVIIDIFGRFLFNAPLTGSYEMLCFFMGGISFFAFAYVQQLQRHINVDVFSSKFSKRTNLVIQLILLVVVLVVFTSLSIEGGKSAIDAWVKGDVTFGLVKLPYGPAKMVVPIGGGVLCLRFIVQIGETLMQLFGKKQEKQEEEA